MGFKFLKPKKKHQLSIELVTYLGDYIKASGYSKEEFAKLCSTTTLTIDKILYKGFVPSVYLSLIFAEACKCRVEDLFKLKVIKLKD